MKSLSKLQVHLNNGNPAVIDRKIVAGPLVLVPWLGFGCQSCDTYWSTKCPCSLTVWPLLARDPLTLLDRLKLALERSQMNPQLYSDDVRLTTENNRRACVGAAVVPKLRATQEAAVAQAYPEVRHDSPIYHTPPRSD
eukprot:scaffold5704_cov31-Tisochrysis_lutea.AAC.2